MTGWQLVGERVMRMTTVEATSGTKGATVIEAAIRFVAMQPGGARRILIEHHRRENGTCAGCCATPTPWPCMAGLIATKASQLDPVR
jgi:hypothetical protein